MIRPLPDVLISALMCSFGESFCRCGRAWLCLCFALLLAVGLPTSLNAEPVTHTVKQGDTLSEISQKYGVSMQAIRGANPKTIRRKDMLRIGDKLVIPQSEGEASAHNTRKPPKPGEASGETASEHPEPAGSSTTTQESASKELTYVVKKGDTLSEISAKFGVSLERLRQLNGIKGDRIFAGQTLKLGTDEAAALTRRLLFVSPVRKEIDGPTVKPGRWKYIVVHHSATARGNAKSFAAAHERRGMENGLAYHFVIGNGHGSKDGQIEVGNRWSEQLLGGHLADDELNDHAIGICFVGDFNKTTPTRKQIAAGIELIAYLRKLCGGEPPEFKSHQEINTKPTLCPGKKFPVKSFRRIFQ